MIPKKRNFHKGWLVIFTVVSLFFGSDLSYGQQKGIASVQSFENRPYLKSIGSWGTLIRNGLPIYSGDKIFTGNGSIQILFHDGSILTALPNTIIRVVESGLARRKRIQNREFRLMIGKIRYESGKKSRASVNIIFPSGDYSYNDGVVVMSHHNNSGIQYETVVFSTKPASKINGAVKQISTEKDVPGVSPETIKDDPSYQKVRASIEAVSGYLGKKQILEKVKNDHEGDTYLKKSRTDRATLYDDIEDQRIDDRSIHYAYDEHLALSGKLGNYAQISLQELITENETYSNHPALAGHAKEIKEKAEAALKRLQDLQHILQLTHQELEDQKRQFDAASASKDRTALSYQMIATLETCSGNEKGMYAQMLVLEGLTTGTQALKDAFKFLEPYAKTVNTFGGRFFIEDLKPLVKAVLDKKEGESSASNPIYVADAGSLYSQTNAKGKYADETVEKLIKLIQVIGNTVSRYSGLNNLLLNAHEANLLDENSGFAEEELLTAIKEWVSVFEIYNDSVVHFKSLDVEKLKKAIQTIVEKSEKVESSDELYKNFISEYIRLSAVLSAVSGNGLRELLPALAAHIESEITSNCRKCEEFQTIKKQQDRCLDLPQCFKCTSQGQMVPDDSGFCDDGDSCTKNDRCIGGVCRGVRVLSAEDPNCN